MSNIHLSRRAIVAGAATLPALAVPAVASDIPEHSDSELIGLADEFESLLPSYKALRAEYNETAQAGNAIALSRCDAANLAVAHLNSEAEVRFTTELNKARAETGADVASRKFHLLADRVDAIEFRIMNTPAHTVAGLRAKALIAIEAAGELWETRRIDLDWDKEVIRELIESVCAVAGVPVPVEQTDEEA